MGELEDIFEVRRNFYGFLYPLYVEEPQREIAEDLVNERFQLKELTSLELNADLTDGFRLLKEFMERNKGREVDALHEDLLEEYTLLFIGPFRLPVEPYEAWWVSGKRLGEPLVKVKADYRKAGIVKSHEYTEPEDYIGLELKFMHHLCEEALSTDSRKRLIECLKLQRSFFDDHILKWVPSYCDALYYYKRADFFKSIAKLTKGFVLLDDTVIRDLLDSVL